MELEVAAALNELNSGWVTFEAQGADFGDKRLNKRYAGVLGQMSKMPQSPFNQSSESLAEMLGAYRFIDNSNVTVERLLAPHRQQIAQRAEGQDTVFLIQDTSYLNYDDHHKCEDLQPLKKGKIHKALWVHPVFCVLPNGLPLGVVDAQFMTGTNSGKKSIDFRPIEEKLSYRWLNAVNNCENIFPANVRKVWICDQEADIYELLEHINSKNEDYIVRSRFLREIEEGPFFDMEDALKNAPVQGYYELTLASNGERSRRTAQMEVKYITASITVPALRESFVSSDYVPSHVIEATEVDPPPGTEPIHWRILTSLKVKSFNDALYVLAAYKMRWAIEELFKILKSGCRAEKAQFQSTERLTKYITLSLIVSWRIYFLVHVNRLDPNAPVETVLTPCERDTLQLLLDDKRIREGKKRRLIIKTARQAITQIARLGGYLDRKNDFYPGIVVIWKGTMALAFSTMTFVAQKRTANC